MEKHSIAAIILPAITIMTLYATATGWAAGACPKVLMFDGVNVAQRFDLQDAKYWASVGIDGFFVGRIINDWTKSAGSNENSDVYRKLQSFQQLYASQGVGYNFLKIALPYTGEGHFGWTSAEISVVVERFREAAHLARYAGLMGLALDLEPQQAGFWAVDPSIPNKPAVVRNTGRSIGVAIKQEFPNAQVIVLPEVAAYAIAMPKPYALSPLFLEGFAQAHFAELVIAAEHSYGAPTPQTVVSGTHRTHDVVLRASGVVPEATTVAIGLWPLGKTYTDKSPHETPASFQKRLELSFAAKQPYVWIYGHGSAWQANGPYGSGPVAANFQQFVAALHRVKAECATGSL
jgi:hypothetical protein